MVWKAKHLNDLLYRCTTCVAVGFRAAHCRSAWAAGLVLLTVLALASCKSKPKSGPEPVPATVSKDEADQEGAEESPVADEIVLEDTIYNKTYDAEFKKIFELANKGHWEEAEVMAGEVYNRESASPGPMDPSVERVYRWVSKQAQIIRDQALEDKIRQIDSKNSVFSPTIKSLVTEQTDRGLPPRKDLRDAVQEIEATPYVPETYNKTKTIIRRSEMFDFKSQQGRMARELDKEISVTICC